MFIYESKLKCWDINKPCDQKPVKWKKENKTLSHLNQNWRIRDTYGARAIHSARLVKFERLKQHQYIFFIWYEKDQKKSKRWRFLCWIKADHHRLTTATNTHSMLYAINTGQVSKLKSNISTITGTDLPGCCSSYVSMWCSVKGGYRLLYWVYSKVIGSLLLVLLNRPASVLSWVCPVRTRERKQRWGRVEVGLKAEWKRRRGSDFERERACWFIIKCVWKRMYREGQ